MGSITEARTRSVNSLQGLYTVVVSLAVINALQRVMLPAENNGTVTYQHWCMLVAFLVTIVRFYHGANRYLDATYVTGERSAQYYALMVDFIALFLEGMGLFTITLFIGNLLAFYGILAGLLVLDIVWVGLTRLAATSDTPGDPGYRKWAGINAFVLFLMIAVGLGNWKYAWAPHVMLLLLAVARTAYDYYSTWSFYYPQELPPAPRPAGAPVGNPEEPDYGMAIDLDVVDRVAGVLKGLAIPDENEDADHRCEWKRSSDELAACYLAIVAICHQTSPQGEPQLHGEVDGSKLVGWDYLKQRFLVAAMSDPSLAQPARWRVMSSAQLSELYRDKEAGLTLSRVAERAMLLNDIGEKMARKGFNSLGDAPGGIRCRVYGSSGLLEFLAQCVAYSDPVHKKGLFLAALLASQCNWRFEDQDDAESPVDYHELRGHLRLGTIRFSTPAIEGKIRKGVVLSEAEDTALRALVQNVNGRLCKEADVSASKLHYLMWNTFRACCVRDAAFTHCHSHGDGCPLPHRFGGLVGAAPGCFLAGACQSCGADSKPGEPVYAGHYY